MSAGRFEQESAILSPEDAGVVFTVMLPFVTCPRKTVNVAGDTCKAICGVGAAVVVPGQLGV
jgi:hypothetical protein